MNKRIILFVVILVFICSIIWWIFGGLIKFYWPGQKEKAVEAAQAYIQKEFTQQMVFLNVESLWKSYVYIVQFYPENNADLIFSVEVSHEFIAYTDNYYITYFEDEMSIVFEEDVKQIWGNEASFFVSMSLYPISHYNIPNLNEKTKFGDIKEYLSDYDFLITTESVIDPKKKQIEATNIYKLIQIIQDSHYNPDRIVFWYNDSNMSTEEISFHFVAWDQIDSIEQVVEYLDF